MPPDLTPEQIEALNADPPDADDIIDDIEEATEDIDELSEQLAVHSIISEERHDEILARVDECNQTIQTLSSQVTQGESPILTQLLNQMIETRAELATLRSSLIALTESKSNQDQTLSESEDKTEIPPVENPDEPNREKSTDERREENEDQKPRPKNRFV